MAVGELGELADEGHRVAHLDSQCRHLARAGRADVDVHVSDRGRPRQLFCRLQVPRFRANDAEVAVDGNATTGQEGIRRAAKAIETQKAVRLDAFHDEPDLIEVSADHQLRPVLAAAPRGRDVAITVDVHGIRQSLHTLTEILDEGLLESGGAVEGDQVLQRVAESILDRRRTVCHQGIYTVRSPGCQGPPLAEGAHHLVAPHSGSPAQPREAHHDAPVLRPLDSELGGAASSTDSRGRRRSS